MLLESSAVQPIALEESQFLVPGLYFESRLDLERFQAERFIRGYQARLMQVISGELSYREILTANYLYDLHYSCFSRVFSYAGVVRTRPPGFVGIAPEYIRTAVSELMETLVYQLEHVRSIPVAEIAMRAHHELVKIHPFVDGNGRTTRMFADLLLATLTNPVRLYNWRYTTEYFQLLRGADLSLDYAPLAAHVGTRIIY